jgi:hypothetical protein
VVACRFEFVEVVIVVADDIEEQADALDGGRWDVRRPADHRKHGLPSATRRRHHRDGPDR